MTPSSYMSSDMSDDVEDMPMVPMGPMRPMESMGLQLLLLAESVANQLGDALRHGAVAAKGTAHSMVLSLDGEVQMLEADGLTAPTFEVARQASLP